MTFYHLQNIHFKSPAAGLINWEQINSSFKEQLKMESDFFIEVKSIEKSNDKEENVLVFVSIATVLNIPTTY